MLKVYDFYHLKGFIFNKTFQFKIQTSYQVMHSSEILCTPIFCAFSPFIVPRTHFK